MSKVIQMLERVSERFGIERQVVDAEAREMGETTAVGGLARQLQEKLPDDP